MTKAKHSSVSESSVLPVVGEMMGVGEDTRRVATLGAVSLPVYLQAHPEGEPTVRDEDLGEAMGLARSRDIKKLIQSLEKKDENFKPFAVRAPEAQSTRYNFGRTRTTYHLTEVEAVYVAMHLETDTAKRLKWALARMFAAVRRGALTHQNETVLSQMAEIRSFVLALKAENDNLRADNDTLRGRLNLIEAKAESALDAGGRIGKKAAKALTQRMWLLAELRLPNAPRVLVRKEKCRIDRKLRNEYSYTAIGSTWERLPNGEKYDLIDRRLDLMLREATMAKKVRAAVAAAGSQLGLFKAS